MHFYFIGRHTLIKPINRTPKRCVGVDRPLQSSHCGGGGDVCGKMKLKFPVY
jgi:hypothetical protein